MLISWHSEITAQAVIHVCDTTVLVSGVRFFYRKHTLLKVGYIFVSFFFRSVVYNFELYLRHFVNVWCEPCTYKQIELS